MKKSGKIFRRLTVLLFTGLLSITFSAPREASAASAKYAAYSENNIYKVGKHRYKASVKNQGSRPKAMLYRKKKGKWKKLLTHQNTYGITVKAEYGKWLYYSVYPYDSDQHLYRFNLKTKKKYLVRRNVRHMLISGNRIYTNGFATDARSVPIYVSRTNGKKAKCITKKANQARMKIYGKRLYYLECTYNRQHTKSTDRLVSRKLNGKGRKVHSKKIKSPSSVLSFSSRSLVYAKPVSGTMRYYRINLKTKKQKRIYPSARRVDQWIRNFY